MPTGEGAEALRVKGTQRERSARVPVGAAVLLVALFLSSFPYLGLEPRNDTLSTLWLVRNASLSEWMLDPRISSFDFIFFFEPGFAWMQYPGSWLEPRLGNAAHHVVGLVGAALLGWATARLVVGASRLWVAAGTACALVLFATPVWYCIADTTMSHYLFATAFGLLALSPVWPGLFPSNEPQHPPGTRGMLASALAYGMALCFKESVVALPALVLFLHLVAFRSIAAAVRFVLPHAVALALFLAWRHHMLGGFGGYFMESIWLPSNWLLALPVVAYATWGHGAVAVVLALLLAWLSPRALGVAAFAWLIGVAPFAFAGPFGPQPFSAARMLLPLAVTWALLAVAVSRRWRSLGPVAKTLVAGAVGVLLVLQASQRPQILPTYAQLQPRDVLPPLPWTEPLAVVSEQWTVPLSRHQLQTGPRAPFVSYRTIVDVRLDRALGRTLAPGTRMIPPIGRTLPPRLVSLPEGLAHVEFDSFGRLHARLQDEAVGRLWLALDFQNGPSRFVASFPVMRRDVDLPLARSMRRIVLFDPTAREVWPARVWDAPAFTDPWPPGREP